jgi:hypothetical protein
VVEAFVCKTINTGFKSRPVLHMEGAAKWLATGLENRGLVMSQWGSIPPLSSNFRKTDRAVMFRGANPRMRLTVQVGSTPTSSAMESGQTRSVGDGCNPFCLFEVTEFESLALHQFCSGSPTAEAVVSNTTQ